MVHPVARSTRVDGRGRGVNSCGGRSLQDGIHKQYLQNYPRTGSSKGKNDFWAQRSFGGNQLTGKEKSKGYNCCSVRNQTPHAICLLFVIFLCVSCNTAEVTTHEPFKWTLGRWEDSQVIRSNTTA